MNRHIPIRAGRNLYVAAALLGFAMTTAMASDQSPGSGIACRTADGTISVLTTASANSQPRALTIHPNDDLWFVLTDANALARVDRSNKLTEHAVPTPGASLRSVVAGAHDMTIAAGNGAPHTSSTVNGL